MSAPGQPDDVRREAYKAARRAGKSPDDAWAAAQAVEVPPTPQTPTAPAARGGFVQNVIRPALQGVTMGFSDELRGAGAALIPGGDDYTTARNKERAALDAAHAEAPILSRVAELAGGLVVPGSLFGKAAKGAGYLKTIGQGAKIGATAGAVAGVGSERSEDIASVGDLAKAGAGGAAGGAVLGGATGAVVGAPRAIRTGITNLREWASQHPDVAKAALRVASPRAGAAQDLVEAMMARADDAAPGVERLGLPEDEYRAVLAGIKRGPTPRTLTWPTPAAPAPVAHPPVVEPQAFANQVGDLLAQPSAAQTARNIAAATRAPGPRSVSSVDEVLGLARPTTAPAAPAVPAQPFRPTQQVIGGPGVSPIEMGQKGFASTVTGKGWAGGDDASQAIHEMYAQTGGPDDFSELLRKSIELALARKRGMVP